MNDSERCQQIYQQDLDRVSRAGDRLFAVLMIVQWVVALVLALWLSPRTWAGTSWSVHIHVALAVTVGGALTGTVWAVTWLRPGTAISRHVAAVAQMLFSALLIHITGGRIETHFHVFGSLAFLAYYRDVKVLVTATLTVVIEHVLRGIFLPVSIYGLANPEWWRFFEHAVWVVFEDAVLVMGVLGNLREMRELATRQVKLETAHATVEETVVTRTEALRASREQYRVLVESVLVTPYELDHGSHRFLYVGPQGSALLGSSQQAWLAQGFWLDRVHPDDRAALELHLSQAGGGVGARHETELRMRRDDQSWVWVRSVARGSDDQGPGGDVVIRGILLDVTERRRLELELQQAQKLESVGRLASGIAHEINTPVQFVSDSVHFLRDAFTDTAAAVHAYQELRDTCRAAGVAGETLARVEAAEEAADLDYLSKHMPVALERCVDGLRRIATLVRSMKEFAHPDQREKSPSDINHALETTLDIARSEYKYVADVVLDLGTLPSVNCRVSELNQVFLNLIVNAAHAIGELVGESGERGTITVATRIVGDEAVVTIADTGCGIPDHVRAQIFDPFFTTKPVGKGTGQGLAIARNVVVDKHGGSLDASTRPGGGTVFTIRLPLHAPVMAAAA